MAKVIGIDLGTTNSCMAFYENGKAKIIENKENQKTTPSIVAFDKNGKKLVGELAKRQQSMNPKRTISSIKREMGQNYQDRKSTRLNSSHESPSRMPSSA